MAYTVTSEDGSTNKQWKVSAIAETSTNVVDQIQVQSWQIYPNPSQGRFLLELSLHQAENIQLNIVNIEGQVIQQQQFPNQQRLNQALDLTPYGRGTYLLQVKIKQKVVAWSRLIVQ
jgi:hypothetical protein